jgi:prevent-host-death family protein
MNVINVHDAKTNLSKLLERVARGECIIICESGKPAPRLEPFSNSNVVRRQFKGGGLELQADSKRKLTAEYLNELSDSRYEG